MSRGNKRAVKELINWEKHWEQGRLTRDVWRGKKSDWEEAQEHWRETEHWEHSEQGKTDKARKWTAKRDTLRLFISRSNGYRMLLN